MRALLLFVFLLSTSGLAGAAENAPCAGLTKDLTATVSHIIDGATLRLHDGRELRLAGIIAPRHEDAGAQAGKWPSAVAARAELDALALGREVEISFGPVRDDRYGRHVGHGFLASADADGQRVWLQGHLVRHGLARVMTTAQNRACGRELLALEEQARTANLGIWREEAYRVRDAGAPDPLLAMRGTFQIVEGEISKAEASRNFLRLDLAAKRRIAVRAILPFKRGARDAAPETSKLPDASNLKGQRVRIRGFVEERGGGPFLDLAIVGDVELLSEAAKESARP